MDKLIKNNFVKKLMSLNLGYSQYGAELIFDQLQKSDEDIIESALLWLENGTTPKISAEGYDYHRLKNEFSMNELASILTIDWLRKDPGKALQALKDGIK